MQSGTSTRLVGNELGSYVHEIVVRENRDEQGAVEKVINILVQVIETPMASSLLLCKDGTS